MADVKFLKGKKSALPEASEAGRLLFTIEAEEEGTPEGHIYYDNGSQLIHLYEADLKAITDKLGDKSVADQIADLFTNSKTIKKTETGAEVKVSTTQEKNILHSGDDGLYVLPGEGIDYSVTIEESGPEAGIAKKYTFKQANKGTDPIGTINIPADMVITKAELKDIEDYDEGHYPESVTTNGTYLVLTIANAEATEIYVLMDRFFDVYTAKATADITIAIQGKEISATVNSGAITEEKLAAAAVTHEKLAENAVESGNINAGAVTNEKLATDAVKATNIEDGAVTAGKLAANAVATDNIAANAVTEAKLDADLQAKLKPLAWGEFSEAV